MGVGKSRINQCMIPGSEIKEIPKEASLILIPDNKNKQKDIIFIPKNIFSVSRSICKINANEVKGSGFLIKFSEYEEDNFYYLMTCEHVIKKELINQKATINFSYDNENKNKEL